MKIQVRKCRVTGKLFEDLDKYALHLQKLRAMLKQERLYKRIRTEFAVWLNEERSAIYDIDDIVPWFIKNQRYIMNAVNALGSNSREQFYEDDVFEDIKLKVRYSSSVSNTHQCPDDGKTNFMCRDSDGPTGYPGFHGDISGSLNRSKKYDSSFPYGRALNIVGLKTGSGGGGNKNWSYGVSIFLADWTGLSQSLTVNKLKGVL